MTGTPEGIISIALDAMGGDHGPVVMVPAALKAIGEGGVAVTLVGDAEAIQVELDKYDTPEKQLAQIVPAEGVVEEGESPARAFRSKPKASIFVSAGVVKMGKATGFVSMGSTGASIAAATVVYGTLDGIDRGALGGPVVGYSPNTIIIDLGTNVDTRPRLLVDFAALGNVMSKHIYKNENPRVALLSVGSEKGKGNAQINKATDLLNSTGLNFIGNIEPNDLPFGKAEVVLCDGFVGNVILKLTEGLGDAIVDHVKEALGESPETEKLTKEIFERMNILEAFGGGPLLGVNGLAIVGHGASGVNAVANAIGTARYVVETGLIEAQQAELDKIRAEVSE
ncbi:MAG TPA: phosphate acyltransferase PlsX [Dehalococcoidia bacterium]|nr:phosphate acyltransferase PlsX [Dehalococcoidia bacterium]